VTLRPAAALALLLSLLLGAPPPTAAAERDGVIFPDRVEAAGRTLVLNGTGTRTYSLLRIKVYVAALYLEAPSRDAAAILASPGPKLIRMRYLQPVDRDDAAKAWRHYLEANCTGPCRLPGDAVARFTALLDPVAKGDTQAFLFADGGVELTANGRARGRIDDPAFARLLLATWIGEAPTSEAVRRGLLAGAAPP
jgi:hypothetical protein